MDDIFTIHSGIYFGSGRADWWNPDYLSLYRHRWDLSGVHNALDVGSGIGFWTETVAALLPPRASIIGVDREPRWVQLASGRKSSRAGLAKCSYQIAEAEALPFPDDHFDLVTCQTLLIHVPDVGRVIDEMARVTKAGGRIVLVEPNNRASMLVANSVTASWEADQVLSRLAFYLCCEEGKRALGEGFNSVGDLLPSCLLQRGIQDVHAYVSDKCFSSFGASGRKSSEAPTESSDALDIVIDKALDSEQFWIWPKSEARRYFLAGGGSNEEFERGWQERLQEEQADESGDAVTAGGRVTYLISGRKRQT